jgi:LPXTG-site transpeptidase (sortase) family protein
LPATGFAPGHLTILPPLAISYASLGDLWLEIPALNIKTAIVGVPQSKDSSAWDVSWLGSQAGWLNGSAFPTYNGNSVLTGHVWNADNMPGLFVNLKLLKFGDLVIIHAFGQVYTYEVRDTRLVSPSAVDTAGSLLSPVKILAPTPTNIIFAVSCAPF